MTHLSEGHVRCVECRGTGVIYSVRIIPLSPPGFREVHGVGLYPETYFSCKGVGEVTLEAEE